MRAKTQKTANEGGFASITVALVIIVVLALLTLAFAQLARHERQSALNKQLSAQAQYAAESGINDIMNAIRNTGPPAGAGTDECIPLANFANGVVDSNRDVRYTCAVVDTSPGDLQADIDAGKSWGTTFSTDQPLDTLTFKWNSRTGKNTAKDAIADKFTPATNWGQSPGVLQVSITPLNALDRDNLANSTFTAYLYPSKPGEVTTIAASSGNRGAVISGACSDIESLLTCTSKIQNIRGSGGGQIAGPFLIRILNYYDNTHVEMTASNGTDNLRFRDSQVKIDVTGKARNVLKRLQVYIPLDRKAELPGYAIEASGLCKRFKTEPYVSPAQPGGTSYEPPSGDDEPICNLNIND